jgi:hypothetical protein
MKSLFARFSTSVARVDPKLIKWILVLVTLALLVIGAGAPESGGGFIG